MTAPKPLAKALHTVTVVARVAAHIRGNAPSPAPEQYTRAALAVLGYEPSQYEGTELFAACVAAVAKACPAGPALRLVG